MFLLQNIPLSPSLSIRYLLLALFARESDKDPIGGLDRLKKT